MYSNGQRVSSAGARGTIRFIGNLDDSVETWLGIEWDDATRGKHSGIYRDRQVFRCAPGSGTFMKLSKADSKLDKTRSFLQAIEEKYADSNGDVGDEYISNDGISRTIQTVGFDRMKQHFQSYQKFRSIFITSSLVATVDGSCLIGLQNLTTLDLSFNLLSDFDEVLRLCHLLPKLTSLKLDGNRFTPLADNSGVQPFDGLLDLSLSHCKVVWDDVFIIQERYFPGLHSLQLASNNLSEADVAIVSAQKLIQTLDLHDNNITELYALLSAFPGTQYLNLRDNKLTRLQSAASTNYSLEQLNLADNPLADISDCKNLEIYRNLSHLQYTLTFDDKIDQDTRLRLICALPQLQYINKTKITQQERFDADQSRKHPPPKVSQSIADNSLMLSFKFAEMTIEKRVLRNQTIRSIRSVFARSFGKRVTQIGCLALRHRDSITNLADETALLSFYEVASGDTLEVISKR